MSADIEYAFDAIPAAGEAMEVAPGIFWVRMPLQLTGLSHINLWAIRDGDGWTLVDTGMLSDVIRDNWERVLSGPLGRLVSR